MLYQPFPMPGAARAHIWHHVPETRRPRHFHSEPELNLVTGGFGFAGRDGTGGIPSDCISAHSDYLASFPYLGTPHQS